MINEFKEFAMRGNVVDLAVGLVLGASFGKIISSLVSDIIMPPIGLLLGRVDFSSLYVNLTNVRYDSLAQAQEAGAATLNYGFFLNTVFEFLVVAFAMFLLIRQINRLSREKEKPAEPATKDCPFCASTIAIKAIRCPQCTSELAMA